MLKKRIIPCLDIKDNRVVKGVNFEGLRDAGSPVELARYYADNGADELVFLDITATIDRRKTIKSLVSEIAAVLNIPFTVGGGIQTVEDALEIISAGADKISLNTSAVKNPFLITAIAGVLGSQCVVVAIDAKRVKKQWMVYTNAGNSKTVLRVVDWARQVAQLGAGEILLTSMDHDGVKNGYNIDLITDVCNEVNIPVIASGGAGNLEHFAEVFQRSKASAALAASIFHLREVEISDLKSYLFKQQIPVRWK
ncbi:MAG: imidazole glycerol phosphate synthase subunit HisF [Bacteroidota bacterium]